MKLDELERINQNVVHEPAAGGSGESNQNESSKQGRKSDSDFDYFFEGPLTVEEQELI